MAVLEDAQHEVARLLSQVDDWTLATPCHGWEVADVARHLVVGERVFAAAFQDVAYDLATMDAEVQRLPTAALAHAYAEDAATLRGLLASAGPETLAPTPIGRVAPTVIAEIRALEAVAHGWDLARALGRDVVLGAESELSALVGAADRLRARLAQARPGSTALGTPRAIAEDAPALDRVVARLGRQP
jgi:uncharacterized protein (TIGR03086 family)